MVGAVRPAAPSRAAGTPPPAAAAAPSTDPASSALPTARPARTLSSAYFFFYFFFFSVAVRALGWCAVSSRGPCLLPSRHHVVEEVSASRTLRGASSDAGGSGVPGRGSDGGRWAGARYTSQLIQVTASSVPISENFAGRTRPLLGSASAAGKRGRLLLLRGSRRRRWEPPPRPVPSGAASAGRYLAAYEHERGT